MDKLTRLVHPAGVVNSRLVPWQNNVESFIVFTVFAVQAVHNVSEVAFAVERGHIGPPQSRNEAVE